ncbi:MAG TPA: fibronectin type III domain-containing protein, partial [Cryobacterium sp.]|nr:fibronectin type III domain-containing protein [Cryobacterium sp.]
TIGASNSSAGSNTVTPFGLPGAPASAKLDAPGQGTGELSLTWTAPASTGGRAITSYNFVWIEGSTGTGSTNGGRSATATGAVGTQYRYQVQACNQAGCGAWTPSNAATPQPLPPPPPPVARIELCRADRYSGTMYYFGARYFNIVPGSYTVTVLGDKNFAPATIPTSLTQGTMQTYSWMDINGSFGDSAEYIQFVGPGGTYTSPTIAWKDATPCV